MTDWDVVLVDQGPIRYQDTLLFGVPDLEHGLDHAGFVPGDTSYRLIQIPLAAMGEVRSMENWRPVGSSYLDAVRAGVEFPHSS